MGTGTPDRLEALDAPGGVLDGELYVRAWANIFPRGISRRLREAERITDRRRGCVPEQNGGNDHKGRRAVDAVRSAERGFALYIVEPRHEQLGCIGSYVAAREACRHTNRLHAAEGDLYRQKR